MTKIYDQHRTAFASVSAYVILKEGERVATIAFKFPRDGAGRLYAYVHWLGVEMVRGHAGGYGYDKQGAAVESAVAKMSDETEITAWEKTGWRLELYNAFRNTLRKIGGQSWQYALERAGFTVLQAV